MKHIAVVMGVLFVCLSAVNISAGAQYEPGAQFNGCIREFYDRGYNNWYAYENQCDVPVSLTYVCRDGNCAGGGMHLSPGRRDSTGMSRREVDEKGGLIAAICPEGYIPVNARDNYWRGGQYRCKKGL
jgi:hypothetical protein